MTDLQRYAWPIGALGDALATLRQKEKLGGRPVTSRLTMPAAIHWDEATLNRWIDGVAAESGLEAEPTQAAYAELAQLISHAAPALVRLPVDGIGNGVGVDISAGKCKWPFWGRIAPFIGWHRQSFRMHSVGH